jgi:hypothetical protein
MTAARDVREHLTEEEFMGFLLEDLPEGASSGVDRHLELCEYCARRMEQLYEAWDSFPMAAWEADRDEFIASLRRRIARDHGSTMPAVLDFVSGGIVLGDRSALKAWAAAPQGHAGGWRGRTEDGGLVWDILPDEQGNLSIFLSSRALGEGTRLLLSAGEWRQEVVLTRVDQDQVGGRAWLPQAERAKLVEGADLRVERLPDGPVVWGRGGRVAP